MKTISFYGKDYAVDNQNFLVDPASWDENFANGMAAMLNMTGGLTDKHWEIITFIRDAFARTRICPVVHETCKALGLKAKDLKAFFPTGYLRGACLISGISYKYGWVYHTEEPYDIETSGKTVPKTVTPSMGKVYRVNLFGNLVDPNEWDEAFAARRAYEMNIRPGLTEKHWRIIRYLRDYYLKNQSIPTIFDCCEDCEVEIDEIGELFPSGYHRCAVIIAGLPIYGEA